MENIENLIGKYAIRTKPIKLDNGSIDSSWSEGRPVKIKDVTDTHIVIKSSEISGKPHYLLRSIWGNNWVECQYID